MDKAEIKRIADFLIDVRKALGEGNEDTALDLAELHRIIQRLVDAILTGQDQGVKVLLASLEHEARLCRREIERRLGARN